MATAVAAGAEVVVSLNASPYRQKGERLPPMLATGRPTTAPTCSTSPRWGGQDELVFDGQSAWIDPQGRLLARAGAFTTELLVVDLALEEGRRRGCRSGPGGPRPATRGRPLTTKRVQVTDRLPDPGRRSSPACPAPSGPRRRSTGRWSARPATT